MSYKPKVLAIVDGGTGITAAGTSGNVLTSYGTNWSSATPSGATPIGQVAYFSNANGDAYLSPSYLKCDGSTYSQATYTTLFARLGLLNPGGSIWTSQTSGTS